MYKILHIPTAMYVETLNTEFWCHKENATNILNLANYYHIDYKYNTIYLVKNNIYFGSESCFDISNKRHEFEIVEVENVI